MADDVPKTIDDLAESRSVDIGRPRGQRARLAAGLTRAVVSDLIHIDHESASRSGAAVVGGDPSVRVPTESECLRIKAFLVVRRNQMRDYLDVAALSAHLGTSEAARILSRIDAYYADLRGSASEAADRVASQVARQLGDPRPADSRSIAQLPRYKGVQPPWDDWKAVRTQCAEVAARMLSIADGEG